MANGALKEKEVRMILTPGTQELVRGMLLTAGYPNEQIAPILKAATDIAKGKKLSLEDPTLAAAEGDIKKLAKMFTTGKHYDDKVGAMVVDEKPIFKEMLKEAGYAQAKANDALRTSFGSSPMQSLKARLGRAEYEQLEMGVLKGPEKAVEFGDMT
ncbi:hypothetical protein HZC07_03795, partial [Candidatus Micrarchaeota archaeon]|nr:hypothetical protein [Candidatus Micrarchaeota archaeon]